MTTAPTAVALVRERFERLARVECAQRSPLWASVCVAVAGDEETLELMLCAPEHQRRPSLLLAAIHDLLLAGTDHELAAYVPTVAPSADPARGDTDRAGALALDFCREHRDAVARILATRSTQTNEVNRAAALLPALVHATPSGLPLRLVELGASAGLNLLLDRFSYRYHCGGERVAIDAPARAGVPGRTARVVCECAVQGELPALAMPLIAERVGVDLAPVDVRDDTAARWLLACVWPDEADRVARVRAAIALAREDPPMVVRGDALALLASLVGEANDAVHPVIWHSWALAYWTAAAQRALGRRPRRAGRPPRPHLAVLRAAKRDAGAADARRPRRAPRPRRLGARRGQLSRRHAHRAPARRRPPARASHALARRKSGLTRRNRLRRPAAARA